MKRILKMAILLSLVLMMVITLIACEEKNQDSEKEDDEAAEQSSGSTMFSVTYNGTVIELGKPAEKVLAALGQPWSTREVFDCGAGKSRMFYQFSSFDLYTLKAEDGTETIDQVEVYDDQLETSKSIAIGSQEAHVLTVHGKPTSENNGKLIYTSGQNNLIIEVEDRKVVGIGLLRKTN
ncbi:MAG: hypothetical protein J6Q82_07570 [Clostridia bacterium]|nr:hypothetical protein [Clostridia bacterium]